MRIVRQLDEQTWRAFVEETPGATIFHTPEMTRVFARAAGHEPETWAVLDDDECLLALLLPVRITVLDRPLLRQMTTRAVAFGSVLCAPTPEGAAALDLLFSTYGRAMKGRALFTELRNLADLAGLQPLLAEKGLRFEPHLNFLIDLNRPEKEIWGDVRSNARRNVRKARKSEMVLDEVTDLEGVADAYDVLRQVYKRLQVPLPDSTLFQAAFEILQPREMFKIVLARAEGVSIGALTLLIYRGVMTYWYTGTLREYSAYRASDLLVWHALELGRGMGCHTFDFGGGGKPDEEYGVRDFKAKFGGTLVNYGRNVQVHAPLRLQASEVGYQLLRRFL